MEMAKNIAASGMDSLFVNNGVLREIHERTELSNDGVQFKGVFIRHLSYLYDLTGNEDYLAFFKSCAASIAVYARDEKTGSFGCHWSGPVEKVGPAANGCAFEALIEANYR